MQATTEALDQKLRGGYYTPQPIAQFLASWAIRDTSDEVLEPSCGDGEILFAAAQKLLEIGTLAENVGHQLHGVELYASEANLARCKLEQLNVFCNGSICVGDFFAFDNQEWGIINKRFDAVIGNPPFLRYHTFPEEQRVRAFRIMQTASLKPTKLTNSWVAFLIAASLRLKEHGRLAMVIPAELLQVNYAAETRAFLARHFGAITLVTFRRLVFAGIQQEVVLLLAEKSPAIESGIDVIELDDASDLAGYEVQLRERHHLKAIDHAAEKWTQYYLDEAEIGLLREAKKHPDLKRFGEIGDVDVGVVTGNNTFFVLNEAQVLQHKLQNHTLPLVGRTSQLPGLTYSNADWQRNCADGVSCHLLNLPEVPFNQLPKASKDYVRSGEATAVHQGYKCGIRKLWYIVPSRWVPNAFLFRQIHAYPKLVFNCTGATSTDTIHRVRYHQPQYADQITLSFLNSLTFAFSEVMGRSYGGGVLELEPNEADHLPLPFFHDLKLDLAEIDSLERANEITKILDITDKTLLQQRLGFNQREARMFRDIWRKLSNRRLGRKIKTIS
ncbi:MAG: class I SAM-dependent methyltransferase [Abitibacteriaceae bacterium]|nr:class I SAM-dependent methyltransferase [Abditibacteriaceae bacterium]